MIPGKLYRHPRCLDIDLHIRARVGANQYLVAYWNRFYRCFQGEMEVVTIRNVSAWEELK